MHAALMHTCVSLIGILWCMFVWCPHIPLLLQEHINLVLCSEHNELTCGLNFRLLADFFSGNVWVYASIFDILKNKIKKNYAKESWFVLCINLWELGALFFSVCIIYSAAIEKEKELLRRTLNLSLIRFSPGVAQMFSSMSVHPGCLETLFEWKLNFAPILSVCLPPLPRA